MTNSLPKITPNAFMPAGSANASACGWARPWRIWTYDQIRANLGEVTDFLPLPPGKLFKPDDDTAFPADPDSRVGGLWSRRHGQRRWAKPCSTIWAISAVRSGGAATASPPNTRPISTWRRVFPRPPAAQLRSTARTLAEQIGGQIFSDIWGLVAPNQPDRAADYAAKAASVTHDGDGIQGARFIAALVSLAFAEREPVTLIEQAQEYVTPGSEYARVVQSVVDFQREQPDDWRACYEYLRHNFGYDRYPGMVHIIPNTGIVVMALLYSRGDFSRAVQIATMGGWDTDCNAGNVGAIMGVAVGLDGLDGALAQAHE